MAKSFKISAKYWASLSEKERNFIRANVDTCTIPYLKRILTLANRVFTWDKIIDCVAYTKCLPGNHWLVFQGKDMVGIIHKDPNDGAGITESIDARHCGRFEHAWNNFKQKNPPKDLLTMYQTVKYSTDSGEDDGPEFYSLEKAEKYADELLTETNYYDWVKIFKKGKLIMNIERLSI